MAITAGPLSSAARRYLGIALIVYAIAFNLPYAWLATNFDYPDILRRPAGEVLTAFHAGGPSLVVAWFAFTAAALLLAPVALAVGLVTRQDSSPSSGVASLGIAAGVTQAIGLSRWVYAVPGLAASWANESATSAGRQNIELIFTTLHQFAGVGIGEAIGQALTAFWLFGVASQQLRHTEFKRTAIAAAIAGAFILLGFIEGLATVLPLEAGVFGLAPVIGFLVFTAWLIWTGIICIRREGAIRQSRG